MTTPDVFRDAEYIADVSGIQYGSITEISPTLRDAGLRKKLQSAAKLASIDRLLRDLDILIYCELSALYYLDCSIVLFAVRAVVQLIFFTPKAPPFDPTRNQPFIGAIFASNFFCIILHAFFSQPEAGEATRGYLHGGILIDFIGQKAPVPVTRLLFLDLLITILNLVMLGLVVERVKLAESNATTSATTAPANTNTTRTAATTTADESTQTQDHDHEERGVLNRETELEASTQLPQINDENEQREQDSHPSPPDTHHLTSEEELERTRLLADPSEDGTHSNHQHALDSFSSGEAVIMRMGLFNVIQDQWRYRPSTVRQTSSYAPSDQTATFLRERFGLQVGTDGRLERIAT
ncbi:hypothetical protein BJY04DRAFT_216848 [Aspergillus karnatakaensis]|uniref:DSC4 family protein n=1 Tax=Aspergillus karnatakaensis TaxID=1810916 RepID=UPI003CCC9422